ncbi:hypothetical protein JOB18_015101 [Solea senegalensis]|uniref:Uncharacterized protein n=1 Tax=Solea senegalensis TaxID=28829 RepID=A0AAV6Q586_SOLSE|nr:hypothetical protein JOB18_015101 [Solea senegalensis]
MEALQFAMMRLLGLAPVFIKIKSSRSLKTYFQHKGAKSTFSKQHATVDDWVTGSRNGIVVVEWSRHLLHTFL